jgi:hypothetical protein
MTLRYTISLLIGFATLILITSLFQYRAFSVAIFIITALWIVGSWRAWRWSGQIGFFGLSLATVVGLLDGQALGAMYFSLILSLLAWDLGFLAQTLAEAESPEPTILIRTHIYRLLVVLSIGLILSSLTLNVQLQLAPSAAIFIGLFIIYGLSRAVRFLRRSSD